MNAPLEATMKARAVIFEWVDEIGGPMQVRDIYESDENDVLSYAIEMEAEEYIAQVHVEYVDAEV